MRQKSVHAESPSERLVKTIRRVTRKRHSAEEKIRIVLDGLRGDRHGHHDRKHDHSEVFSTWSYETDQPLALEALQETMRKLPGSIYRVKGIVYTTDSPQRRTVLQAVGRRVDISFQEKWGERVPRSQIVAIGTAGTIDASLMEKTFAACISTARAIV